MDFLGIDFVMPVRYFRGAPIFVFTGRTWVSQRKRVFDACVNVHRSGSPVPAGFPGVYRVATSNGRRRTVSLHVSIINLKSVAFKGRSAISPRFHRQRLETRNDDAGRAAPVGHDRRSESAEEKVSVECTRIRRLHSVADDPADRGPVKLTSDAIPYSSPPSGGCRRVDAANSVDVTRRYCSSSGRNNNAAASAALVARI